MHNIQILHRYFSQW